MKAIFTAVAMATTVVAALSWVLYIYGMALRRAGGQDLFGFVNAIYWGMAVGSPFAFTAMFVHPFIVDNFKSWILRGLWVLCYILLVVWHLCFAGAILTVSSREVDMVTSGGFLVNNDLGLIFCGSLGSIIFGGMTVGVYYARDLVQIKDLRP